MSVALMIFSHTQNRPARGITHSWRRTDHLCVYRSDHFTIPEASIAYGLAWVEAFGGVACAIVP